MAKFVELKLAGRPRRLGYNWRDAGDMSRMMGGQSLQQMLQKLGEMDPTAIKVYLWHGLKNFDKALKFDGTDDIVQSYIDDGGMITDLLGHIFDALNVCGVVRVRQDAKDPDAEEDPATRPPAGLT